MSKQNKIIIKEISHLYTVHEFKGFDESISNCGSEGELEEKGGGKFSDES